MAISKEKLFELRKQDCFRKIDAKIQVIDAMLNLTKGNEACKFDFYNDWVEHILTKRRICLDRIIKLSKFRNPHK